MSNTPTAGIAIDVEDLWFRYPVAEVPALKGVEFQVRTGEMIGIIGPSGAGKSTLCQALKGLIPHSTPGEVEGEVRIFGADVTNVDQAGVGSERIGLVLQDPEAQIIGMTVREDLAFGPENLAVDPEEIRRRSIIHLADVGLEDLMDRDTYELSGGQKQRLAIASALMLEPDILIFDEPTSELDPLGKDEVFEVLRRIRQERDVTIVVVEHEVDRLASLVDRIIVMSDGEIVIDGPPLDVLASPGARANTAGERLPSAADFALSLQELGFTGLGSPTFDLAGVTDDVAKILERKAS